MLWLHNSDWDYNFSVKQGIILRKFISGNALLNWILISINAINAYIQLKLQDFYKKVHYLRKIYIGVYAAISNTNISILW